MGRPKGSVNKPKESEPIPVEDWNPKPNMGSIKPPKPEEFPCGCGHIKGLHYGSKTDWCNFNGCKCQRFN